MSTNSQICPLCNATRTDRNPCCVDFATDIEWQQWQRAAELGQADNAAGLETMSPFVRGQLAELATRLARAADNARRILDYYSAELSANNRDALQQAASAAELGQAAAEYASAAVYHENKFIG